MPKLIYDGTHRAYHDYFNVLFKAFVILSSSKITCSDKKKIIGVGRKNSEKYQQYLFDYFQTQWLLKMSRHALLCWGLWIPVQCKWVSVHRRGSSLFILIGVQWTLTLTPGQYNPCIAVISDKTDVCLFSLLHLAVRFAVAPYNSSLKRCNSCCFWEEPVVTNWNHQLLHLFKRCNSCCFWEEPVVRIETTNYYISLRDVIVIVSEKNRWWLIETTNYYISYEINYMVLPQTLLLPSVLYCYFHHVKLQIIILFNVNFFQTSVCKKNIPLEYPMFVQSQSGLWVHLTALCFFHCKKVKFVNISLVGNFREIRIGGM